MTWQWPVSRLAFERACTECERWRQAYEGLLAMYHGQVQEQRGLVRDGYHPPQTTTTLPSEEPDDLTAEIRVAIEARGPTRDVRRDMEGWARDQIRAGVDLGDIAGHIWAGEEGL